LSTLYQLFERNGSLLMDVVAFNDFQLQCEGSCCYELDGWSSFYV